MPRLVGPAIEAGALSGRPQPTIEVDDELVLRPFAGGDAPAVLAAFADPAIRRWSLRRIDDPAEARAWIAGTHEGWAAETAATWAVGPPGGVVRGRVTLSPRLVEGAGEVTYWVVPEGRGQGVAPRAVRALTRWAHDLGLVRVELRHSTRNPASCRVAEKAGFAAEGVLRSALRHGDGWHDMHLHADVRLDGEDEEGEGEEMGGDPPCWEDLVDDQRDHHHPPV